MGRKGQELREAKRNNTVYTFTRSQLEEHDLKVRMQYKDVVMKESHDRLQKEFAQKEMEIHQMVEDEWNQRASEFKTGDRDDDFFSLLQYVLSVPVRVLIEKYHWKPVPKGRQNDMRYKLNRLADQIVDEISSICSDEEKDIRKYCEETYDMYGIKFVRGVEHEIS